MTAERVKMFLHVSFCVIVSPPTKKKNTHHAHKQQKRRMRRVKGIREQPFRIRSHSKGKKVGARSRKHRLFEIRGIRS